ncbi:MAG: hypothetical protein HA496_10905 [Thaumarchaeota archaeon]|nr:hypothetical protein [Nitrososphaerota archaeon]
MVPFVEIIGNLQLDVEPMAYVSGFSEVLREDEPAETLSEDDVLKML